MIAYRFFQRATLGTLAAVLLFGGGVHAEETAFLWNPSAQINLTDPLKTRPLEIAVSAEQSLAYGWSAGSRLWVRAYVERPNGSKAWLRDVRGRRGWRIRLDRNLTGSVTIVPAKDSYSGPVRAVVGGREWPRGAAPDAVGYSVEKSLAYVFDDGVAVRVHYADQTLERYGVSAEFARQALDAAVLGYQTITQFQGFRTAGYAFADPSPDYAQDPDRTIDVYIGDPAGERVFTGRGFNTRYFKDAPCFDTIDRGGNRHDAVILLPANYPDFIRNWEKINPSSLGRRNIEVDLRGTLVHEMLHVIVFYYNRNLGKDSGGERGAVSRDPDWYVEGLARYFETFVGARHDFFSQGFKQTLPDKIRFSRGGSNYFMRFPDQAFTGLRYENALFWRYLDHRFGMASIEKLSRLLRGSPEDFPSLLEEAAGTAFGDLLDQYALSVLLKDFGLKDETGHLVDVARTRLLVRGGQFSLIDGFGAVRPLGKNCATDWAGAWGSIRAAFGEPSAGGDSTAQADVSAWATDYFEILPDSAKPELPALCVAQTGRPVRLTIQAVILTRGGSTIRKTYASSARRSETIDLPEAVRAEGLDSSDVEAVYLLVTNHDRAHSTRYELQMP